MYLGIPQIFLTEDKSIYLQLNFSLVVTSKCPWAIHHEMNGGGEVKVERDSGLNHLHL